jgi:hypothetical protein
VKRVEYNCVAMSHLQDLRKVASGLAMVVKESMKMAPRFPPENVGGSAFEILKAEGAPES